MSANQRLIAIAVFGVFLPVILTIIYGCCQPETKIENKYKWVHIGNWIERLHDKELGVVCYRAQAGEAPFCVKEIK